MVRNNSLRILVVTPSLPYPPNWGFGIRVYQMIKHLAMRHRVSLLTYAAPEERDNIAALEQIGATVHTVPPVSPKGSRKRTAQFTSLFSPVSFQVQSLRSPAMQAKIKALLVGEGFDLIQIESSQMAGFDYSGATQVLDEHNVEYELLYRMYCTERAFSRRLYNGLEYLKFRREERASWLRADACLLTSAREEEILRQFAPGKTTRVVPNGVDIDYFQPSDAPPDPNHFVYTGLMNYRPNIDAVVYFVHEILPRILRVRPEAVFTIVGYAAGDEVYQLAGPNVVVTGGVPDVRPYVARAAVNVVPLRMGSGTRLKVLEGLAMGKAVVSTAVGCEGIGVTPGEHLLVADDPAAFAEATLRLSEDTVLAATLGRQGRALVERDYSWTAIVQQAEELYAHVLSARTNRAPAMTQCASRVSS